MTLIAHTTIAPAAVDRLRSALPDARLLDISLQTLDHVAAKDPLDALLVDGSVLRGRDVARLAVVRRENPWLAVIALAQPNVEAIRSTFELGRLGIVDDLVVSGVDDLPAQVHASLSRVGLRAVAATIEFACAPLPPVLARPHLEGLLERIVTTKLPRDFAARLDMSLPQLRQELQASRLFPPKALLARFRLLVASRLLQDESESVERIGVNMYASATAFRNAFRALLGVTPGEVRQRGGLRFAGQLFRFSVQAWRAGIA